LDIINLKPIYAIPFISRFDNLAIINKLIEQRVVRRQIKKKFDYVILNEPKQIDCIPEKYSGIVIYDCMDEHSEFVDDMQKQAIITAYEKRLVERADIIFASSDNLKKQLQIKYNEQLKTNIHVVRNGYDGNVIKNIKEEIKLQEEYIIAYFGTVSSWFNFEYIEKSLDVFENIKYRIIGPVDVSNAPKHERIDYVGVVEHAKLYDSVKDVDLLILPFWVNKLIESVDPVKLYEYINMNKNILCSYYDEIARYEPFVYFYNDYKSYIDQLAKLMKEKKVKYSMHERELFLAENSWRDRAQSIKRIIEAYHD